MTPEQIRFYGLIGLCLCLAYWLVLFLLKPKDDKKRDGGDTYNQTHSGSGDNTMKF